MDRRAKTFLLLFGIIALASGSFFAAQGVGLIRWPASSFMIHDMRWVYLGGAQAVIGLVLIFLSRR
jgi:hypothetical protein